MNLAAMLGRLVLFAAIVIAGIILISDGFMSRVDLAAKRVENYAGGVLGSNQPRISRDFSQQFVETKSEVLALYDNLSHNFFNRVRAWIADRLKPPASNL
jgi:hypothetical protein